MDRAWISTGCCDCPRQTRRAAQMACGRHVDLLCVVWSSNICAYEAKFLAILDLLDSMPDSTRIHDVGDFRADFSTFDSGDIVRSSNRLR